MKWLAQRASMMNSGPLTHIALILGPAAVLFLASGEVTSADLLALWLAGKSYAAGDFAAIYAGSAGLFEMRPPAAWPAEVAGVAPYPYVYPPIWAWAMSFIAPAVSFPVLSGIMAVVNPVLLAATLYFAGRMTVSDARLPLHVLVGTAILATSQVAIIALKENQPHILLAFLLVYAVSRFQARPAAAGASMALAAALKLRPAAFAVIWAASGGRRAAAAFLATGTALALLSVAVAGWPLHAAFLGEVSAVSRTVLASYVTITLDTLAADLFFQDRIEIVTHGAASWGLLPKGPLWRAADLAMILSALGFLAWLARRGAARDPLFWPGAFVITALVSPLAWVYHYLAAFVFLPTLIDRLGPTRGGAVVLMTAMPLLRPVTLDLTQAATQDFVLLFSTAALFFYAAVCLTLAARGRT